MRKNIPLLLAALLLIGTIVALAVSPLRTQASPSPPPTSVGAPASVDEVAIPDGLQAELKTAATNVLSARQAEATAQASAQASTATRIAYEQVLETFRVRACSKLGLDLDGYDLAGKPGPTPADPPVWILRARPKDAAAP